jgi:hypothetical protein
MKTKHNSDELAVIAQIQERDGITRKSAIRKFQKDRNHYMAKNTKAAVAPAPDYKQAAANDKPETPKAKAAPAVPQTDAGKARSAGIQLFITAGRPTKEQFIHVFGERGARMTWVERAKAVGMPSAEMVAASFQHLLAQSKGSALVTPAKA